MYNYSIAVTNQDENWMSKINAGSHTRSKYEHHHRNGLTCAILCIVATIKRKKRRPSRASAQAMEKPHNSPVGGASPQGSKQDASPGITILTKTGRSCSSKLGSSYS
jgi:hypothetical protein